MRHTIGAKAKDVTFQEEHPLIVPCSQKGCKGNAELALAVREGSNEKSYVRDLHDNDPTGAGLWPHDAIAVAVYICRKCLGVTARMNQA